MSSLADNMTLLAAYSRYQSIRDRLPTVSSERAPNYAQNLKETIEHYDGFIFDSFGVLNVGESAIPGAGECLTLLREMGKKFCILTNAASYTSDMAFHKYRRLGLDVRREEIVSSRDITFSQIGSIAPGTRWAAISDHGDQFEDAPVSMIDLLSSDVSWSSVDGFVFLSSARWTPGLQDRLVEELRWKSRPVIVGNPDLVAPREGGLSKEPGLWAHDLQDRCNVEPVFFGKPYASVFDVAFDRLGSNRVAMVGDTLHTDILGAQACDLDTVLVTRDGLFAQEPVEQFITDSGIFPDWIIPSIGSTDSENSTRRGSSSIQPPNLSQKALTLPYKR